MLHLLQSLAPPLSPCLKFIVLWEFRTFSTASDYHPFYHHHHPPLNFFAPIFHHYRASVNSRPLQLNPVPYHRALAYAYYPGYASSPPPTMPHAPHFRFYVSWPIRPLMYIAYPDKL